MKKILLDFSAIKSGGGAQRALNFLNSLKKHNFFNDQIWILKPKNHFIELEYDGINIINTPTNFIIRYIYEYIYLIYKIKKEKISLVFTFAGSGLPACGVKSIVSVNYPTICYNDSVYWDYISFVAKLKQKIKCYFRIKRISKASIILLQTNIMLKRVSSLYQKKRIKYYVLPPAPSQYVSKVKRDLSPNFLVLSSNYKHKNIWRLYDVAKELKNDNFYIKFYISIEKNNFIKMLHKNNLDFKLIDEYFVFLGEIKYEKIQSAYSLCSFMLQLSDLESFSNNYMEAWKAQIPLIVSDRDFSRHICKDSAIYVDPHDPKDVSEKIKQLVENIDLQNQLIKNGQLILNQLPTQDEYFNIIIDLISNELDKEN